MTSISPRAGGSRAGGRVPLAGRWRAAALAVLLAVAQLTAPHGAGQAHAQLPGLGENLGMSAGAERRLGDLIARDMYRDPAIIDDPVLGEYLAQIWEPLLGAARRRGEVAADIDQRFAWQLFQVRDRSINAFALPGGYLGVHLGLVAAVGSRDELAAVMAHELSHVSQRHIARMVARQSQQAPWVLGAMILAALAARGNVDLANAAIVGSQAAAMQGQLNFSRDMEREADRVGLTIMEDAGFAPRGVLGMFERLQQASRLNDNGSFPYLRTHPLTTERIADAQARLQLRPEANPRLDQQHAMMAARARVLSDSAVDALRQRVSEAQSPGALAEPARAAGVLYGAALAASRLRDHDQARALAQRLADALGNAQGNAPGSTQAPMELVWLQAELALAALQPAHALRVLAPHELGATGGRATMMLAAQARLDSGAAAVAAQTLQAWVIRHPNDAAAWDLLARAQAARGQNASAVRAQAEARMARLDISSALDHFRSAQQLARQSALDHVEQSILDARTRQAEQMLREQQRDEREFK